MSHLDEARQKACSFWDITAWATLGGFLTRHLTVITHGAISASHTWLHVYA